MGNPILLSPQFSDDATITGATTPGSMGLGNLLLPQPTDVARFSSLTGMYLEANLGVSCGISYIWLGYTNASEGASVRIRAATSQANLTASPVYDVTVPHWPFGSDLNDWPINHFYHNLLDDSTIIATWWRLDITDDVNPAGFYQAGRIAFVPTLVLLSGTYVPQSKYLWQASAGLVPSGLSTNPNEEVRRVRSEAGQVFPKIRPRPRVISAPFRGIPKAEAYDSVDTIARLRGVSETVIFIADPDDLRFIHQQTVYGLISEPVKQQVIGVADPPLWQVTLNFEGMV